MMEVENGMVSGAWPYNTPMDDELTPNELAYIYGDEKTAPVQTARPTGKTSNESIPTNQTTVNEQKLHRRQYEI